MLAHITTKNESSAKVREKVKNINVMKKMCFFLEGIGVLSTAIIVRLFSTVSFFACTCSNQSEIGAIDNIDLFEHVFDQYDIREVPEKTLAKVI